MRKDLKKFFNKVLAIVLTLAMLAPCLPQGFIQAKAAGESFVLDFGNPTDGVVNPTNGSIGPIFHGSQTYIEQITTGLKGNGWSLNVSKTNIPYEAGKTDRYQFDTTTGAIYHSPKSNKTAFASELEANYMYSFRMAPGNKVAFDFDVQIAGTYDMQIIYVLNGVAAATVTVNGTAYNSLIPTNSASTADAKTGTVSVNLVAGTNTIEFATEGTSGFTAFRAACFTKTGDAPTPTSAPTEEPTSAPIPVPTLAPTTVPTEAPTLSPSDDFILDFGNARDGVVSPVDGTVGPIVHSGTTTYGTQQLTTALKGNGWTLNVAKTNIPITGDRYAAAPVTGAVYHSPKTNKSSFGDELESKVLLSLRLGAGNTVAFDFNAANAGLYELQVIYTKNALAKATVHVNDFTFPELLPGADSSTNTDAKTETIVVALVEGTNTIAFTTEGDANYAGIRAACFTKVDDPAATPTPTEPPLESSKFADFSFQIGDLRTEADAMARLTTKKISYTLLDELGRELTNIDPEKLHIGYSTNNVAIANVSDDGFVTAISNGNANIGISITYDGININKSWNLQIADAGYNLLDASNPGFETNDWLWSWTNEPDAPATAKFMRTTIGTMANDENANNRAFQIILDGSVPANANPKDIKFNRTGARIKVDANRFYQLSFKVKSDYVKAKGAADLMMLFDLTAYTTAAGDSSSFYPYLSRRQMDLSKVENWREIYSEWTTVTLPISAPTACEYDEIYLTPHIVIRPSDLTQAGYDGSIWIDDLEIREVGYEGINIEVDGKLKSTSDEGITFAVVPYATTGNKMSLSSDFLAKNVSLSSTNERVISNFGKATVGARVSDSGQNDALVTAEMMGGIGEVQIGASLTLNDITKYTDITVSTTDTDVRLLYAEAGFDAESILPGKTIQVNAKGFLNNGVEADITNAKLSYKSLTPNIVTVDQKGLVTAVANGIGQVSVTITQNNISVEAIATISVKDDSKIVSASLTAPATVGYKRDVLLSLTGVNESGYATDFTQAQVEWVVSSDAVTVDDRFYAFGNTFGETVSIYALVTLNGNQVQTNTVEMKVVETDLRSFEIDFKFQGTSDAQDATLEENGWELAPGITYRTPLNPEQGLTAYTDAVGTKFEINIDVPYEGVYQIALAAYSQTNNTAALGDIYIDGIFIGDYVFTVGSNTQLPPESFRSVFLTEGTHKMTFIPTVSGAKKARMVLSSLTFKNLAALPEVTSIDTNGSECTIILGDTYDLAATMKTADGVTYAWQPMLSGAKDPMASVSFSTNDASVATISKDGVITSVSGGSTFVTVTVTNNGVVTTKDIPVTVDASDIDYVTSDLNTTRRTFYVGEEVELGLDLYLESGAKLTEDKYTLAWSSSDSDVIDFNGNKMIAKKVGEDVIIYCDVTYFGKLAVVGPFAFDVKEDEFGKVIIVADTTRIAPNGETLQLSVAGETHLGQPVDLTGASVSYYSLDNAYATVSDTGLVTSLAEGKATIAAVVELNGIQVTGTIELTISEDKVGSTYYTEEVVEIARENYRKYKWVQKEVADYVNKSHLYLLNFDRIYSYIHTEDIPRTWLMQNKNAPDEEKGLCAYCGNGGGDGGHTFIVDPINMPWKVQCKYCKNWFPSNDFAGLYENVIAANNGVYDVNFAREWNAENVANGGKDYLKNELYPEYGDDWCVDDGKGYFTTEKHSNGQIIQYNFIPYFAHCGIWYNGSGSGAEKGIVMNALQNLSMAYLFTGDAKYGRACAILVDRIADVYPSFDMNSFAADYAAGYHTSNGSSGFGKIIGCIWECFLAQLFPVAYDAVYDMYDDEKVIEYLSDKASEYHFTNDKTSAEKIRKNIEDNLLREIRDSLYEGQIMGNFGLPQNAMAVTAVVLDSHPETEEMLDWLYKPQVIVKHSETSRDILGGGLLTNMVNNVSRDGQGNESAFGYNDLWVTNLLDLGIAFDRYDEYNGTKLFDHPKYIGMILSYPPTTLVRRGAPAFGDGGGYAKFSGILDIESFCIPAFTMLYENHPKEAKELAEYIYSRTGDALLQYRANSLTKDPESIGKLMHEMATAEPRILDADKSTNMTGYGFAALRSGTLLNKKNALGLYDTQRDVWMYYGGGTGHKHNDALNIGIDAYGVSQSSDLGYPEGNANNQNKAQWQTTSIAHNTVVVNEQNQMKSAHPGKNLHFDGKGERVQVMDVDASHVYAATDDYRRTIVSIDYDENISYSIDFFKVLGGDDHLYSFHASSDQTPITSPELTFVQQNGGTYAGPNVPYGNDPGTSSGFLQYPIGYSWLTDVHKAKNPGLNEFFVEFATRDYREYSRNEQNLYRLRMTMLNDFAPDEISLVNGQPPRKDENKHVDHIEYMLVRRTGHDLNTLFTTVIEPYTGVRYITNLQQLPVSVSAQSRSAVQPSTRDAVKAIKVDLLYGRTDYVFYATNEDVLYTVTDGDRTIDFKGFVGVVSYDANGEIVYTYVHNGTTIANVDNVVASLNGTVLDFEKDFAFDNWVDVRFDRAVTEEEIADLTDRLVIFDRDRDGNSDMMIEGVTRINETDVRLHFGIKQLIDNYVDNDDDTKGFVYDVAEGMGFTIPLTNEVNNIVDNGGFGGSGSHSGGNSGNAGGSSAPADTPSGSTSNSNESDVTTDVVDKKEETTSDAVMLSPQTDPLGEEAVASVTGNAPVVTVSFTVIALAVLFIISYFISRKKAKND